MKRIALVFFTVPYGTAVGREGLDVLLVTSTLTDDLAVFFITDGVLQLLLGREPDAVLARDYTATFKLLGLYDTEQCRVCAASLRERGSDSQTPLVVEAAPLEADASRREFANYDVILRFRGIYATYITSLTLANRSCCAAVSAQ